MPAITDAAQLAGIIKQVMADRPLRAVAEESPVSHTTLATWLAGGMPAMAQFIGFLASQDWEMRISPRESAARVDAMEDGRGPRLPP